MMTVTASIPHQSNMATSSPSSPGRGLARLGAPNIRPLLTQAPRPCLSPRPFPRLFPSLRPYRAGFSRARSRDTARHTPRSPACPDLDQCKVSQECLHAPPSPLELVSPTHQASIPLRAATQAGRKATTKSAFSQRTPAHLRQRPLPPPKSASSSHPSISRSAPLRRPLNSLPSAHHPRSSCHPPLPPPASVRTPLPASPLPPLAAHPSPAPFSPPLPLPPLPNPQPHSVRNTALTPSLSPT